MIRFGTGGWRAIIGEDFTADNVKLLAQAVSIDMKNNGCEAKGIVIGYDRRFLSDKAGKWMAQVLAANGIKVFFIERIAPTPMTMFTVKQLGTSYGAAVTASHNPAEYNGVKIFTKGGRDATEDVTNRLEGIIDNLTDRDVREMEFQEGKDNGIIKIINPFNDYIDAILNMLDIEAIRKRGLKILLDPMFGVSKTSLQTILLTARCEVDLINDRHDTLFGGRLPSPSAVTLSRLKNLVVERHYDLGIGTDGDADRIGIIDEKGNFIHPNEIMVLLYYYLHKYKGWKGAVVRNLATTHLLDRIAHSFGEECYEVPVGFKHISSKMEETGALIGGESSGGLTIRGHIRGKDGIFAAGLLIEMLSVTGRNLSDLLDDIYKKYGKCIMVESDYRFTWEERIKLGRILFEDKRLPEFNYPITKVSYLDGVKVYFEGDGWVIARFSGTEPLLRIFAEMPTEDQADEVIRTMSEFLGLQ
jgi:phosphomannomutase